MTNYQGNDALSPAVKERVLTTFQQTLTLYKQGRTDEVFAGIGLILRMDPQFDPAKKLLDKARNPSLPIDVDSLVPAEGGAADPLDEARQALATRDFQRAVNITTEILTNDLMNEDARIINEKAREKMEAAPFVEQFAKKCENYLAAGNLTAARSDLDKARALDSDHPAIRRVEQLLAGGGAAAPAPAAGGFSFDSPSFVVETPQAPSSGRGTAQAADFGFTFEEDKQPAAPAPASGGFTFDAAPAAPAPAPPPSPAPPPAAPASNFGFSFDTPAGGDALSNFSFGEPQPAAPAPAPASFSFDAPAPEPEPASSAFSFGAPPAAPAAPAPGPSEFDFSGATTETSPDDQRKIDGYLADGDRAFDSGDFQKAIDLWSRIFLIDVTNEQASERIERAKVKRRDAEQKGESILAAGIAAFEKHDAETARAKFSEVLRIDPNNASAQDYLDRLNDTVTEGGAGGYEAPFIPPSPAKDDLFADDLDSGYSEGSLGIPDEAEAPAPVTPATKKPAKAAAKPAPVATKKSSPIGLIAVLVGAIVLVGGGWFAYTKFIKKSDVNPAATQALFKDVERLATQGKFDQAIAMLQDIKPDDPMHDKANLMISELQQKKAQAAETIDGKPASVYYQENLANGKTAFEAHDYDGAKKAWDNAVRVRALSPDIKTMYDTAAQQVAKLDNAKTLFKEARYQDAIANLEPLLQQDPQNRSIQRMILDSHFNLGASALQDERLPDAIKEFDEVLKADPNDELAKRSRDLANRYNAQPKDLLYKIYVKYLPLRKVS